MSAIRLGAASLGVVGISLAALAAEQAVVSSLGNLRLGPSTTVVTQPLNAWGYPDYVAVLDEQESQGVAADDNFWTLFDTILPLRSIGAGFQEHLSQRPGFENAFEATPRFAGFEEGIAADAREDAWKDYEKASAGPWTAAEHPMIATWLNANGAPLAIAATAARRPKAYAPNICGTGPHVLANVLLPHVQESRGVARALTVRAMLALGEGRQADAWQDILTLHRIAAHLERSEFIIARLVGIAIRSSAMDAAGRCLVAPDVSSELLAAQWEELVPLLPVRSRLVDVANSERLMSIDLALALRAGAADLEELGLSTFSMSGEPGGMEIVSLRRMGRAMEQLLYQAGDINKVLETINEFHDAVAKALAHETYGEREAALAATLREFKLDRPQNLAGNATAAFLLAGGKGLDEVAGTAMLSQFSVAFQAINKAEARGLTRAALLRAARAAETIYRSRGSEIVDGAEIASASDADAAEILDPFVSRPFQVKQTDEGLMIYSVGVDGIDQQGKMDGEADDIRITLPR